MSELYVVRFGAPDEEAEIEEDDGTDTKSTFAYFGLAFYHACVLEHSVVNLLVGSRLVAAKEAAERLLADPWEKRFKDTMMELVRRAAPYTKDDPELPDNLVHAVKLRNHLAHDFWRERAEDFCSDAGRGDMIAYLIEARDHFIQTDARLEETAGQAWKSKMGVTQEAISARYEEMLRRAKTRDAE
jgi:hypothetical protein